MSFYSEASLAYVASAGAGKDGKAYSMKPVPEYGAESVTNGDFDTDSDWTKETGWTIANGKATFENSGGAANLSQSCLEVGKTYLLTFDTLEVTGGNFAYSLGSGFVFINDIEANKTHKVIATAGAPSLTLRGPDNFNGSIDNVSVKEVLVADGDFTFSRGVDLTATRVGPTGLIEKGRENLLKYSNQFDTTWTGNPSNRSITSGFSGYDGTNNAWKLEAISDNNYSVLNQLVSSTGVETFSVYAKAGTSNFFRIQITGGTNTSASYFDLSGSGSVGVNFNNINAKIESVGNGWFRCSVTGNKTTSSTCVIYVIDAEGSTNVTTGKNIYIQDAQLEIGLAATDYIESGASTGKAGLLEDEPRFDYSGGATCPSLLLEPSRTNLVRLSEALINGSGGWTLGTSTTLTLNDAISPEGVKNAFRLDIPTGNNTTLVRCDVLESTDYTFSFYVKRGTATELKYSVFNFSTLGNIVATTSYFSQTSTNDFVRIVVPFTTPVGCTDVGVYLDRDSGANGSAWFYGIQLEQGSYPTSYIPNHSGGIATRTLDVATNADITDELPNTGYTIFFEVKSPKALTGVQAPLNFLSGTSDRVSPYFFTGDLVCDFVASGVTRGSLVLESSVSTETTYKVAISVDANNIRRSVNGSDASLVNDELAIPSLSNVRVGSYSSSSNALGSTLQQIILFDEILSDADIKNLTTL